MGNRSAIVNGLTRMLLERQPKRTIMRGSMGDGFGNVLYPLLDDYCYVRLYDSDSSVVTARNLTVPMMDGLPIDVERTYVHSKVQYFVVGLTQGIQFSTGTQPIANAVLHAYTHEADGYDPIIGGVLNAVLTAIDYTMDADDRFVGVTSTGSLRIVYLYDATKLREGTIVVIKDVAGGATTNNIRVQPIATQDIDNGGPGNYWGMVNNYQSLMLIVADGNWSVLSSWP